MRVLSRKNRNTIQAVAYRSGTRLYDERTGQWFEYRDKNVALVELLLPPDSHAWARDLQELITEDRDRGVQHLSNLAERAERRKNSRVYREFEFALPLELTKAQNVDLTRAFLQDQVCRRGMMVLSNFHFENDEETGEPRPHCHALFLTRRLGEQGLTTKNRDWDKNDLLLDLREQWAAYANFHLALHGHQARIDHRSYAERGIDIEPQLKLGHGVREVESRAQNKDEFVLDRRSYFEAQRHRNVARLIRNPHTVFEIVTSHQSTFMWGDVEKVLARYVRDQEVFDSLNHKLKTSGELVLLREEQCLTREGEPDTRFIYTTQTLIHQEVALVEGTERLAAKQSHKVKEKHIAAALARGHDQYKAHGGLSADQVKALHHITKADQLSGIIGYAGTGKSTLFRVAQEAWKASGYRVYGLAPTGRAADNLEQIGISADTLHKFLESYKQGRCQYRRKTVLILDEAGMVGVETFHALLTAVEKLGIKLVICGDGAQAQPIKAGPGFRLITERLAVTTLETVVRQKEKWQRQATQLFGRYQTRQAVQMYVDQGQVQFIDERVPRLEDLVVQERSQEVVRLYNLSSRICGTVWHTMAEQFNRQKIPPTEHFAAAQGHEDFVHFQRWQKIRRACAEHIASCIDTYRDLMVEAGVDPRRFAGQFVRPESDPDLQQQEIKQLMAFWDLKAPTSGTPLDVGDLRAHTRQCLVKAWVESREAAPDHSHLMITSTNRETHLLNQEARGLMRQKGVLEGEDYVHTVKYFEEDDFGQQHTIETQKAFARGERVVFLHNDRGLGVKNGTLGVIESIDRRKLKVKLVGEGKDQDRIVSFASKLYPYFDRGWAVTITKSQGATADHVLLLATSDMERNQAYVGMTRQCRSLQVFGSRLDFVSRSAFIELLSRGREKLAGLDYLSLSGLKSLMTPPVRLKQALTVLGNKLEGWEYYSLKRWESLCEHFLGQTSPAEQLLFPQESVTEAVRARELGINVAPQEAPEVPKTSASHSESTPESPVSPRQARRLARVHQLRETSHPLAGTLAERYIKEQLGVSGPLSEDLRFIPDLWHTTAQQSFPALVALARDGAGRKTGLQVIYLDRLTGQQAACARPTQSIGFLRGSAVQLQPGTGAIYVARNLEQALRLQTLNLSGAIYAAPLESLATFLTNKTRPVIICQDPLVPETERIKQVTATLTAAGFSVSVQPLHHFAKVPSVKDTLYTETPRQTLPVHSSLFATRPIIPSNFTAHTAVPELPSAFNFPQAMVMRAAYLPAPVDLTGTLFSIDSEILLRVLEGGAGFISSMATQKAVFTQAQLEREIVKQCGEEPLLKQIVQQTVAQQRGLGELDSLLPSFAQSVAAYTAQVLASAETVALGPNAQGDLLYTSQEYQQQEQEIGDTLKELQTRRSLGLTPEQIQHALAQGQQQAGFVYSEEQRQVIPALLGPEAVVVLTGQAGTGKTTVLKPMVAAYQQAGYTVLGTSFQGKVADMLSRELAIEGYTLHQLTGQWQNRAAVQAQIQQGELSPEDGQQLLSLSAAAQLTPRHVVVVDEGNMVPGALWHQLLREVHTTGALLRIVQDSNQIKTLSGGDIARLIETKLGSQRLSMVHRQTEDWMKQATSALNHHQTTKGLQAYHDRGHLKFHPTEFSAKYSLIQDYLRGLQYAPQDSHMMLAFHKADVEDLSIAVRERLKARGDLGTEHSFTSSPSVENASRQRLTTSGTRLAICEGERVMFTANDHRERWVKTLESADCSGKGVKNGTFGIVEALDVPAQTLQIRLQDGRLVGVDFQRYDGLTYAYATTVNKAEGETYDHVYGLFQQIMSANSVLIWASRHRATFQVYVSQEEKLDFKELTQAVNKSEYRGLVADTCRSPAQQAGFEAVVAYKDQLQQAAHWRDIALATDQGSLLDPEAEIDLPAVQKKPVSGPTLSEEPTPWDQYKKYQKEATGQAREILGNWSTAAPYVQQIGLARDTLEVQAGRRLQTLSDAQLSVQFKVEHYFKRAAKAQSLRKTLEQTSPGPFIRYHDAYKDYQTLTEARNELAYGIASLPDLYGPLLKLTEHQGKFTTRSGTIYEERPASFQGVFQQARQYSAHRRQAYQEQQLTPEQVPFYTQVKEYQQLARECGFAYHYSQQSGEGKVELDPHLIEKLSLQRDQLAYEIVSNAEACEPWLQTFRVKQDQLLAQAARQEVKHLIQSYQTAPTVDQRVQGATALLASVTLENGKIGGPYYGLLKAHQITIPQLRFEQSWEPHAKEGSVETLTAAYAQAERLKKTPLTPVEIEAVCSSLLGAPFSKNRSALRYGSSGQISVSLQEETAGRWKDFKTDEGGRLVQLVQREQQTDVATALNYIAHTSQTIPEAVRLHSSRAQDTDAATQEWREKKIRTLSEALQPLPGSLAHRYLIDHRQIKQAVAEDLQFHPGVYVPDAQQKYPAIAAVGRDSTGKVSCIQVTYLEPTTAQKADLKIRKQTFGAMKGCYVTLQKGEGPIFLAEGVETALSLKEAGLPGDIYVALGISNFRNFGTFNQQPHRPVIIAADNDGDNPHTTRQLDKAKIELTQQGFTVTMIQPNTLKEDFNDVLKKEGPEGVQRYFAGLAEQIEDFQFRPLVPAPVQAAASETERPLAKTIAQVQKTDQARVSSSKPDPIEAPKPFYRLEEVNDRLTPDRIESLCNSLLGPPSKAGRSRTQVRYKGGMVVSLQGNTAGLWKDFKTGDKGNLYQLVQRQRGVDFKEALIYVAESVQATPERRGSSSSLKTFAESIQPKSESQTQLTIPSRPVLSSNAPEDQVSQSLEVNLVKPLSERQRRIVAYLEKSIDQHEAVPDSYKRFYLKSTQEDPEATLAQWQATIKDYSFNPDHKQPEQTLNLVYASRTSVSQTLSQFEKTSSFEFENQGSTDKDSRLPESLSLSKDTKNSPTSEQQISAYLQEQIPQTLYLDKESQAYFLEMIQENPHNALKIWQDLTQDKSFKILTPAELQEQQWIKEYELSHPDQAAIAKAEIAALTTCQTLDPLSPYQRLEQLYNKVLSCSKDKKEEIEKEFQTYTLEVAKDEYQMRMLRIANSEVADKVQNTLQEREQEICTQSTIMQI